MNNLQHVGLDVHKNTIDQNSFNEAESVYSLNTKNEQNGFLSSLSLTRSFSFFNPQR